LNEKMKVALVHDYLKGEGGAEQVLLALHEMFPNAPIYTAFSNIKGRKTHFGRKFTKARIVESWLARLPFCDKLISPLRFLLPLIWGSFDFSEYDVVISSASWAVTKGFSSHKTIEICYCHTPPRYLYGYETSRNWQKYWIVRLYASIVNHIMRQYDFRQAQKVTYFIANSRETQARIKKFYRRESKVIYPPVEIKAMTKRRHSSEDYFLAGGRLELPKNFDIIIKACNQLKLPLKIFGIGPQEEYLCSIAGLTVKFLGSVSDEEKDNCYVNCLAYITAATDEDFGITPVEAMAAGRPVIAFRGGGYLESVVEGKTGEFFNEPTVESLVEVLKKFKPEKYKPEDCQAQAKKFSKERFKKEIKEFMEEKWGEHKYDR